MNRVHIKWIDSATARAVWERLEDLEPLPPCHCETVGFLVAEKPAYKTVASTVSETMVVGLITIPTKAITSIKRLRT
ncbi:MAG TPA: hypothetical protein VMY37_40075 [Thermoguttaceae bacterium]|nr:hypothetical protein [Thermoguttaceae bacterium]